MEPIFQVSTTHSKESYHAMVTADYVYHHKPHTAVFYVVLIALGAFFWWGAVFASGREVSPLYAAVYGLVILGICVLSAPYLDRFSIKRNTARILKSTLKKARDLGTVADMSFTSEGFTLETPEKTVERPYTALSGLAETRGYFVLMEGKDFFFTLAKRGFTQGTSDEFRTFLAGKCGKEFKFLDF
ncbi:MAG: YcxB family protein [Clostridia bacterium]|nr:YcxB family protein [Clostridia bacterium]